jgi:hypothetical protein
MNKLITNDNYLEVRLMSKFYGQVVGNRGAATRCGHSRIKSSCQSWNGSIVTEMTYDDDKLMVSVCVGDGSTSIGRQIFYGTFDEYVEKLKA